MHDDQAFQGLTASRIKWGVLQLLDQREAHGKRDGNLKWKDVQESVPVGILCLDHC